MDHLKEIRQAAYQTPQNHTDDDPSDEAVILGEHFREAQRLKESGNRGGAFLEKAGGAEKQAQEIGTLLREAKVGKLADVRPRLDLAMDAMNQTCSACHRSYRDPAPGK